MGSRGDASLQTGPRSDLCRCVEPLNSSHLNLSLVTQPVCWECGWEGALYRGEGAVL